MRVAHLPFKFNLLNFLAIKVVTKKSWDFIISRCLRSTQQRRNGCKKLPNHSLYHTKISTIYCSWMIFKFFIRTNKHKNMFFISMDRKWKKKFRFESDFCGVFACYAIVMKWDFHCCPSPHCWCSHCCVGWFFKNHLFSLNALKVGRVGSERGGKNWQLSIIIIMYQFFMVLHEIESEWNVECNADMICISYIYLCVWNFTMF